MPRTYTERHHSKSGVVLTVEQVWVLTAAAQALLQVPGLTEMDALALAGAAAAGHRAISHAYRTQYIPAREDSPHRRNRR